ncbi:hypothetical protein COLO4_00201 [Corchorus olitorius]|uniref:Uncharacterized protein n=1 Tax=Corchorus olitorius TaxID=93759 RepID=A0A1R3L4F4_9ROSI|nr:hypothetical protein COLO4_00201 [Corchorus olitorius]
MTWKAGREGTRKTANDTCHCPRCLRGPIAHVELWCCTINRFDQIGHRQEMASLSLLL